MKIIAAGPRNWGSLPGEKQALIKHLDWLLSTLTGWDWMEIEVGDAAGFDEIVREWAKEHEELVVLHVYVAAWRDRKSPTFNESKNYDPLAGHRRNRMMIRNNQDADIGLVGKRKGRSWSRGTYHSRQEMKQAKIPIQEVNV